MSSDTLAFLALLAASARGALLSLRGSLLAKVR